VFARSSLEFALFKPFATPSVSRLLVSTREFLDRCPRRAEDTELILSEIIDPYPRIQNQRRICEYISEKDIMKQYERREAAINRLNEVHGKYSISDEDYLYTLVLFVTEPLRWLNKWEWRKLDIREVNVCILYLVVYIKSTSIVILIFCFIGNF
jgi:hypothetical protein